MDSETKKVWIGVIVVALIAGAYYFGTTSKNSTEPSPTATQQPATQQPQVASIEQQKQCSSDGKTFTDQWLKDNIPAYDKSYTYVGPEYHFSTKLNTCLSYIGYVQMSGNDSSTHLSYIYNIYTNSPVLESSTFRTCNGADPCSEIVNDSVYSSGKTLGSSQFYSQKDILFSQ